MTAILSKTIDLPSGGKAVLRSVVPDEAQRLLDYVRSVARETPFFVLQEDEFNFTDEQERQWIREHLEDAGKLAVAAEVVGEIVGFLSFENNPQKRLRHRGAFGVSVAKPWRGQGLGTALVQTLIDWAEADPLVEKIGLAVYANNENAIRLYEKLGFLVEGRRPREMKIADGQYVDDLLMYRFV
jgi:RimJ/RimL family protein N-acetyltransferase